MPLTGLRRRLFCALGAVGLVSGCDQPWRIDRVDALIGDVRSYLLPLAAGGLPTEVRGAPFEGLNASQVIARLQMPNGLPADLRFRIAEPGDRGRLVIVFNPEGPPDGYALCRGDRPGAGPALPVGFVALASLCNGTRVVVTARLTAEGTPADDPAAFTDVMRQMFAAMFKRGDD